MIAAALVALALSAGQQAAPNPTPAPLPAPATTGSATGQAPLSTVEAPQVCRRQPIPGSRRTEQVCRTQAEWDQIRANARGNRDAISRNQRDGGG